MEGIIRTRVVDIFNNSHIPIFFDEDVATSFEAINNLLKHPVLFREAEKIRKEKEDGKDRK